MIMPYVSGNFVLSMPELYVVVAFLIILILIVILRNFKIKSSFKNLNIPQKLPDTGYKLPFLSSRTSGNVWGGGKLLLFNDRLEYHRFLPTNIKLDYSEIKSVDYKDSGGFGRKAIVIDDYLYFDFGSDPAFRKILSFFKGKKVSLTSNSIKFLNS